MRWNEVLRNNLLFERLHWALFGDNLELISEELVGTTTEENAAGVDGTLDGNFGNVFVQHRVLEGDVHLLVRTF